MKKRRRLRKGLAMLLSLAMVAGLVPAMSGGANKVQAATGSGTEPSVSAYATKTQLMDGTFAPNADGTAVNIGKLVFGKNSSGNPQEWYILGKDGDVLGDNTIIFAASPIATNQVFNSSANYKTYNYGAGTGYGEPAGSTTVNANHYGASDLRVKLQDMAGNTTFFTPAEQGLMNATTVTTKDTKIDNTYTTTDKLYALAADGSGFSYKTIKAGTSGSTVLAMSSYWSSGDWFWLRSPKDGNVSRVLLTVPGTCVNYGFVDSGYAVQPASNLNLSSVLFASAATAASSDIVESDTIASGTAMTLRLNGTGKNIGTVTYYATTGDIKVAKGSTSQTVALVVQGNDGTNDWYYSKKIDAAETVNASAINSALSLSSDIDLSGCKIWLEITDTDGMIYAVGVTEVLSITSVEITGIDTPVSNTALDTEAACATTGVSSTTPQITWTPSDSTAGYNTSYTASITLTAGTGYEFINSTTATVLENTATSVTKNADGTLTVTYAFSATAKDKLTSITPPQAITVANGTAYSAMNLPATVNIVTEGNTVTIAPVTWDTTTPASGSYDPAVLTEQTVTLNGEVTCQDSIDANGVSLTTTITITISAAGIVGAPTANPTAGTYSENQSVKLTSSTEGATIYYTTDGSEPTITGGVLGGTTAEYTAPIAVTGTEGQSVTTTIKAIAVKNGMQDSSVETFTYTIHQIPVAKYTYATKTQLMDGTFAPITDGTAVNIGKLVFGKNISGNPQEWYILGKDESVSGDNTIIFAANPIKKQVFEDVAWNNKTDSSLWSDCDYSDVSITEVCPNHYGASDLRVALKGMATNISYFTTAEQGLMNATTVTTYDKNNRVTYTTTDNLYALQGDYLKDKLWAGTSDSTVLARSSYWSSGDEFWLRSPSASNVRRALYAIPGDYVRDLDVDCYHAVQPASNLNLSSVLFASSAKAASSDTVSNTIASETAMTLRFDGTGKDIGTVSYNATTGDIKVAKGSTEGDVALVVQGKDGTNDWYYSKKIDAAETVNASDIKSALKLSSDIDLSACKIWLEITDKDGMIYAVNADKEIEKINTTYVTKEQLMNSFKPYSDGTAVNTGKLVFGKKSDGTTAQQWYILGKDTGVSGDNTIIFAASPIETNQVFNSSADYKTYNYGAGTGYGEPAGSTTVNANHYGASDLRVKLQDMAGNTTFFTSAEQGLMNATTVTTKDTKIDNTYTTTDKLYALAADGSGSSYKTIKAGTSGSTVLAMSSYWSSGDAFWLRSPYGKYGSSALLAHPGYYVYDFGVSLGGLAVQPASNLNLSSVLFASAAQAASSDTVSNTIASETAMTLRLDGTGKNIGTVTYNTTTGDIKAVKGSTSQTVALVVQGNDGTNDWYYSKKIDEEETVNASNIKSALSLTSDIDLSDCKIWLEITDTDGMIYAVGAAAIPDAPHIEHVDSNNDNICDSCGKYMDNIGARLAGHSLTLDGSVGVNFYMELSSEVISDGSAYMEFTLPGGKTSIVNVSDANTEEISGKTYYKFRCQVNAAEMTDTITAQLRSTVGNSKVYEYTVKEYADYLFAHKEDNAEFAKAANLIEAMVNYGSYAQIYAGYNAENLAVGDAGNLKSVGDVTIGEYTYTPNVNETKVQFAGANLSLLSTTTLRMYFRLSNVDVANVTFTYGGNTLEKTQSGDYYYVELVGIPASKLDDDCVVTVNDGTNSFDVTYTPMAYCANVVNRETTETRTESLKNLMKALVLYNRAADAYIGNTDNGNQ